MNVDRIIYAGPSLFGCRPEPLPGEIWKPPARCGDIVRDVKEHALKQIVLIDGVFAQSLAVWHKELVYALLEGVVCIGASSMGALRAAELWRYGMLGIGKIFQMYKDGEEDDSLVALTYDPETYRLLSEAPVGNKQKTLDALEAIAFARGYNEPVKTTLTRESIGPFVDQVLERILED
jgi:hypothetical protein